MEDGRDGGGSSASDLYNTDNPPGQEGVTPSAVSAELANAASSRALTSTHISDSDSDSDSSSEMDVAESDDEPEPESKPKPLPPPQPEPHAESNGALTTGAKRKLGDEATNGSSQTVHALPKKPRLSQSPKLLSADSHPSPQPNAPESNGLTTQPTPVPSAQPTNGSGAPAAMRLPTRLWQRIFLFMPPTALGRCLSVCKTFNIYLTQTKAAPSGKKSKDTTESIHPVESNELWSHARKTWVPNMPRPLVGFTELQMIQLVGGYSCQSCGKVPVPLTAPSPFEAGPGSHGVRAIWPFGIRTCGQCLERNTMKDILLYKSENSVLAPGLPHALITQGLNFIPDSTMRQGGAPANLGPVSKRFHQKDIARIKAEYNEAQEFGDAAAEEWKKGLIIQGKEAMTDAARWEKWEAQMPPGSDLSMALREYDVSFPTQAEAQRKSAARQPEAPAYVGNGSAPRHGSHYGFPQLIQAMPPLHYGTGAPAPWQAGAQAWPPGWPPQYNAAQGRTNPREGDERNKDEQRRQAEERQQMRKKEIERRSAELDPELEPGLLGYMNSFKAAIQIPQLLTDQAWDLLRPRILQDKEMAYAAREAAEAKAYEDAQRNAVLNASRPSTNVDDSYLKPAKEIYDKDYERAQQPLRERLAEYVTELVEQSYNADPDLDRESSPAFAANAIVHVFRRYTEDKDAGNLPAPPPHSKRKEGSPPLDPFLSLDNVKWLFENKIKSYLPHAGSHAIFLCAGCLEESPPTIKWLAFEGLMQHYASKHTSAFSQGNIIVHWQLSDWPEEPPFHTHPEEYVRRRASGHKGPGKPTPKPRRNGPFQAPGAANTFPRNNQESFSNGYNHGAHGYAHHSYGQGNHVASHGDTHGPSRASRPLPIEEEFDNDKVHQLTTVIRQVFDTLEGISEKDLPNSVRIHTALKIANERFLEMYKFVPTLDHFTEAITSVGMEAIKNAGSLACKQCVASQTDKSAADPGYLAKIQNAKLFTLGAIINHFKIQHLPNLKWSVWMRDMILLPESKVVANVVYADNMDDNKLALLNIAFEDAFPQPLPKLSILRQFTADTGGVTDMVSKMMSRTDQKSTKPSKKRRKGKPGGNGGRGGRDGSQELPTSEPQEHEYDPRKPMETQQLDDDEEDLSKYDSDIVRKMPASSVAPADGSASNFGLAPETLQALQALGMPSSTSRAAAPPAQEMPAWRDTGRERAPSVGRDDSNVQPDIAAILASLTNGMPQQSHPPQPATQPQQHATSPPAGDRKPLRDELSSYGARYSPESRSDRAYHPYQPQSSYGQHYSPSAPSPAYAPQTMTPQQWQAPQQHAQYHHQPAAEPPTSRQRYETPGSDLQAALERNAQHYVLNQQAPPTYSHHTPQQHYAYPQHPTYADPHHYQHQQEQHIAPSPPRYRYVHDDPGRGQQVQYLPPPPQQQYAHASASASASAPQGPPQHAVQRTVYVDEHGRELRMLPEGQQYGGQGYWEYGQNQGGYGGQGYGGR